MNEKNLTPDYSRILEHLQKIFSGYGNYKDGLIEIAYTPPNSSAVNSAQLFALGDITSAAQFAYETNKVSGRNVYVGAALRNPDSETNKRASLTDFYASNVVWLDLDDEGSTEGIKDKYKDLPPYHIVVTGRVPHTRAQLWWKLNEEETNPHNIEIILSQIQKHFGGDPAVVDPIRVMRLGGTIAWPKKEGRVPELTTSSPPQNATELCAIERIQSCFPGGATHALLTNTNSRGAGYNKAQNLNDGKPRHVITGKLKIQDLLEATRLPHQWHFNMRDAIASMVSSGWSDEQIKLACAPYCDGGVNDKDLLPLIGSGRKKWGIPDPETGAAPEHYDEKTGEITTPKMELKATSIRDIDLDNIPVREFVYGDLVGRKYVSMLVAPPGAGKSIFTLQIAIRAACGQMWGDMECPKPLNVWVYNNEEGLDEIKRRLKACMMDANVNMASLKGELYVDSGEKRAINLARVANDTVIATPDFYALKQEVIERKIDLLVIDPFAETHAVAESNNDQIKIVSALYRDIAIDTNCAVLLVHHTRKYTAGDEENAGNIDNARGGGAQIGVVRRAFTLSTLTKTEAKKIGVPEENRRWFVRLDDAKSNITAPADRVSWFKFKSIDIGNGNGLFPNGDSVGVLVPQKLEDIKEEFGDIINDRAVYILTLIAELWEKNGRPSALEMPEILDYIKDYSKLKLAARSIRDAVKEAIMNKDISQSFVHLGVQFRFSVIESGGKNNAYLVKIFYVEQ